MMSLVGQSLYCPMALPWDTEWEDRNGAIFSEGPIIQNRLKNGWSDRYYKLISHSSTRWLHWSDSDQKVEAGVEEAAKQQQMQSRQQDKQSYSEWKWMEVNEE
jgi:hypothetical protein